MEGEGRKQESGVLRVLKMPFGERMFRASATCTWHIARTSFICFSSGEIKDLLASQSVPRGDYSSYL